MVGLLVCQNIWVNREELLLLLWSDDGATKQRLRQLVYRTKQLPYGEGLVVQGAQLGYHGESDVQLFRQAIQARDWQAALELYAGELLLGADFEVAELEEWFLLERALLSKMFRQAALEQALTVAPDKAATLLEQALLRDPLSEELLRALLAVATPEVGQRAFERYRHNLAQMLQLEPATDLQLVVQALQPKAQPRVVPAPPRPMLPTPSTVFVGRQAELEHIGQRLSDPLCRLLSIVGVGGIGKTRLSLEVAARHTLPDGVVFVDLARLNDAKLVPSAILKALQERPTEAALERLKEILENKATLLVLDNFEHLLAARETVQALLEAAPLLRFIVTSRESLGLRQEHVFELTGLPAPDTIFPLESQDAAQVFSRAAQRSDFHFSLNSTHFKAFERIFRSVAGLPLGLELAASWIRTLSLEEIADELDSSLDVLAVDAPDMPARHRSFAAVFYSSWALLSPQEQSVLAGLSVFRGGFDKDMAVRVTNSSLPMLLRLVHKSLVVRLETRFVLHELIRQYSQQQLTADQTQQTLQRLSLMIAELSQLWLLHKKDEQQTEISKKLEQENDNIRTVLRWALEHDLKTGTTIVGNLEHFWYSRGYHREGLDWANQFLARYTTADPIRLAALWTRISLAKELSEYELSRASLTEYQIFATQHGDQHSIANSQKFLGLLEREQGNIEQGKTHLETALAMYQKIGNEDSVAICHNDLGIIFSMQNNPTAAKQSFEESLRLKRQLGDKQGIAYAIGNLGVLAGQAGDFALEQVLQLESLRLKRELGDQQGIANGLQSLGENAFEQHQIKAALDYYSQALDIFVRLGRRFTITVLLVNFATVAAKQGQLEPAIAFMTAAIHWRYQLRSPPPTHWTEKLNQWRERSQYTPAQQAKLEFEMQKLSLEESVARALAWKDQALMLQTATST